MRFSNYIDSLPPISIWPDIFRVATAGRPCCLISNTNGRTVSLAICLRVQLLPASFGHRGPVRKQMHSCARTLIEETIRSVEEETDCTLRLMLALIIWDYSSRSLG